LLFKKNDVNVPSKSNKQKNFFLDIKDENSRIWSWIRSHWSEARIRGSGYVPKCHGSPTLIGIKYSGSGSRPYFFVVTDPDPYKKISVLKQDFKTFRSSK
jgi:hypothetical protein